MAEARIEELRRRVGADPTSRLFGQLAEECRRAGEYAEAIRVARAGLRQHPGFVAARVTLGRALLETGDVGGACGVLEEASRLAPENILAARFYGRALARAGDIPGALGQLEATLRLVPGDQEIAAEVEALRGRAGEDAGQAGGIRAERRLGEGESGARSLASLASRGTAGGGRHGVREEAGRVRPPDLGLGAAVEGGRLREAESEVGGRGRGALGGVAGGGGGETGSAQAGGAGGAAPGSGGLDGDGPPLWSSTLGELYLKQGFPERAIEVYRQVVRQSPENVRARLRLAEIEGLGGAGAPVVDPRGERRRELEKTIAGLEALLRAARWR